MEVLDAESTEVCPWALREGIMLRHLESHDADGASLPLHPLQRARDGAELSATVATLPDRS
jgi:exopolyphosphatase/guanosine-5'-triphosphate,3'-diphosphate pyrophosphatase